MMEKLQITKEQACRFILAHQRLWPPFELKGKPGILNYIRKVNCIQFDPLNIVGHNQELALQARIVDFHPLMLQELLYQDRKLIDIWDKNMSVCAVEDWPYFRRNRESAKADKRNSSRPIVAIMPKVLQAIEEQGPLSSADLNYDQFVDWPWAPTRLSRAVLESMYFQGELVIHHKAGTRKIYDLTSRQLPAELRRASDPNRTEEQYHDWYVLRRIGSVGLLWNKSGDAWLGISGIKSGERGAALARLLELGKVTEIAVEGVKLPFYMRSEDKPCLDKVIQPAHPPARAAIMAPLDNLLWDRKLIKELFGFDYRWEVYKPVAERTYGYYVLPVLYGDRFIARFEPGRDKQNGVLIIKDWWWEEGISPSGEMCAELINCFNRFAEYLGVERVVVGKKTAKEKGLEWLR